MKEVQFPTVQDSTIATAKGQALLALRDSKSPERIVEYFDPHTNYAGATFAGLQP